MQTSKTSTMVRRGLSTVLIGTLLLLYPLLAGGCKPSQFLQKNACELVNCDYLFFIDDMFPLAAAPSGMGGGEAASGGAMDMGEEEEEGGHMH